MGSARVGWSFKRIRMERGLKAYVERAAELLPEERVVDARMFLDHGEHALAVEHIIDWLGDLEIQISGEFAEETLAWCSKVRVTAERQAAARALIKSA